MHIDRVFYTEITFHEYHHIRISVLTDPHRWGGRGWREGATGREEGGWSEGGRG